jgi:predicted nucleotidyltransferase
MKTDEVVCASSVFVSIISPFRGNIQRINPKIHRMINSQSPVRLKRNQILRIAAQNGVKRLRVFGSVARGTEDEQSDIDFLVELAPDRRLLDLGNFH